MNQSPQTPLSPDVAPLSPDVDPLRVALLANGDTSSDTGHHLAGYNPEPDKLFSCVNLFPIKLSYDGIVSVIVTWLLPFLAASKSAIPIYDMFRDPENSLDLPSLPDYAAIILALAGSVPTFAFYHDNTSSFYKNQKRYWGYGDTVGEYSLVRTNDPEATSTPSGSPRGSQESLSDVLKNDSLDSPQFVYKREEQNPVLAGIFGVFYCAASASMVYQNSTNFPPLLRYAFTLGTLFTNFAIGLEKTSALTQVLADLRDSLKEHYYQALNQRDLYEQFIRRNTARQIMKTYVKYHGRQDIFTTEITNDDTPWSFPLNVYNISEHQISEHFISWMAIERILKQNDRLIGKDIPSFTVYPGRSCAITSIKSISMLFFTVFATLAVFSNCFSILDFLSSTAGWPSVAATTIAVVASIAPLSINLTWKGWQIINRITHNENLCYKGAVSYVFGNDDSSIYLRQSLGNFLQKPVSALACVLTFLQSLQGWYYTHKSTEGIAWMNSPAGNLLRSAACTSGLVFMYVTKIEATIQLLEKWAGHIHGKKDGIKHLTNSEIKDQKITNSVIVLLANLNIDLCKDNDPSNRQCLSQPPISFLNSNKVVTQQLLDGMLNTSPTI